MTREISDKLVTCFAKDDFKELSELLSDDVIFTAAAPGSTWHGTGIEESMAALRDFFSPDEIIERTISMNHFELPGRSRVSYRLQGRREGSGNFEYEHQAYYQVDGNRISRLRILCSGLYSPEK